MKFHHRTVNLQTTRISAIWFHRWAERGVRPGRAPVRGHPAGSAAAIFREFGGFGKVSDSRMHACDSNSPAAILATEFDPPMPVHLALTQTGLIAALVMTTLRRRALFLQEMPKQLRNSGNGTGLLDCFSRELNGICLLRQRHQAKQLRFGATGLMIACHCNCISDHDIDRAISWMRASDPRAIITPGKVFRVLGKKADCGSCMPLFLDIMRKNDNLPVQVDRASAAPCPRRQGTGVLQNER